METTIGGLFESERQLSWRRYPNNHQFGGQPGTSVSDAFTSLGLDFDVELAPLVANINGTYVEVPGKNAIVRSDAEKHVYGVTGSGYRPLQNRQIAALLDPMTERWGLDTVAITNHGRDLLITLKCDPYEVNGDQMQEYFWGLTSHDGLKAIQFALTDVRLWCTNQLITGLRAASFRAQVTHSESTNGELSFQLGAFQMLEQARRATRKSFEQMATVRVSPEQLEEFLARVYPEPNMPRRVQLLHAMAASAMATGGDLDQDFREKLDADQMEKTDTAHSQYEYAVEVTRALRSDAKILIEKFNDEHTAHAGTPWAVYNAVVELADYRGPARYAESAAMSALTGDRAREKERAFQQAMLLTDPNWRDVGSVVEGFESAGTVLRQARETARAEAARIRAEKAEERRIAREARLIESGQLKPRLDAEGNVLPPLTAAERAAERLAKEEAEIQKLEERIAAKRAKLEEETKTAEQRLADRRAAAIARAQARGVAVLERSAILESEEQDAATIGVPSGEASALDEDEDNASIDLSGAEEDDAPVQRRGRK